MKYKILIFDLDDTLIDNRESVKAAFRQLLEHEGATFTEEAFERWYQIDKQFWIDWQDGLIDLPERLKNVWVTRNSSSSCERPRVLWTGDSNGSRRN